MSFRHALGNIHIPVIGMSKRKARAGVGWWAVPWLFFLPAICEHEAFLYERRGTPETGLGGTTGLRRLPKKSTHPPPAVCYLKADWS